MKIHKCSNCGANIKFDEDNSISTCPYCNTPFSQEKEKQESSKTTNQASTIINNYYDNQNESKPIYVHIAEQRPKFKIGTFILLLIFGFYPGIIYAVFIALKQQKWDEKYNNHTK